MEGLVFRFFLLVSQSMLMLEEGSAAVKTQQAKPNAAFEEVLEPVFIIAAICATVPGLASANSSTDLLKAISALGSTV